MLMRRSPPAWGRGLKQVQMCRWSVFGLVAPRVGAWIETTLTFGALCDLPGRPPRGGVD